MVDINFKYLGTRFISCLLLAYLAFTGFSSVSHVNYSKINKNSFKDDILSNHIVYDPYLDKLYRDNIISLSCGGNNDED